MKFGVREICDVVLRAKTAQKIGKKIFYKNEPVCYFDTLKTSTMEGAATTVYAQGGRGNARLMSWDGERTVTFTMEDALISPIGLSILTGAGLIEADYNTSTQTGKQIIQHITETVEKDNNNKFYVKKKPYLVNGAAGAADATIYVMILDANGEVVSEPYLGYCSGIEETNGYEIRLATDINKNNETHLQGYDKNENTAPINQKYTLNNADVILVDYYTAYNEGAYEINITPDKFGGTFYLEASTLWRDQATKKDLPAEFIIPACRVQSNFTFSMSSSGDPSTFTFTMDAFPDYTRWNKTEKVLATIQVIGAGLDGAVDYTRDQTWSARDFDEDGIIKNNPLASPTFGSISLNGDIFTVQITNSSNFDYIDIEIQDDTQNTIYKKYCKTDDDNSVALGMEGFDIVAGKTYTFYAIGYKNGQASPSISTTHTV